MENRCAEQLSDSEDDHSLDEEFGKDEAAAMEEKDTNVINMVKVAEQYKATIVSLRSEISNLESEKNQLALKEAREKKASVPASTASSKVQKELLEKTRTLEAKLKQLRQKEVEYARIYQEKEKARKEAEQLRKELTDALKKRVAAAKKLKEEGVPCACAGCEVLAKRGVLATTFVLRIDGEVMRYSMACFPTISLS